MSEPYPRDLVGYGAMPPHPGWPGEARAALSFVLNYEEGGETSVLHGDPVSEVYLHEVPGLSPRSGQRDLSVESTYEYGARAGFWRVRRLFVERGLPLTVHAVGMVLERNREPAREAPFDRQCLIRVVPLYRRAEQAGGALQRFHRPQVQRLCLALWGIGWLAVALLLLIPLSPPGPSGTDLLAHVVLFGAMAFAAVTFCHHAGRLLLLALLTVLAAAVLELAQGLVPYRSFDLLDVLAGAIGCAFGYAAALIVLYLAIRPSAPPIERTDPSRA